MTDRPTTDEWTEQFGQFQTDVDTHIGMLAGDDSTAADQYTLRRMIFISLRDYFRNTSDERFRELKQQA